MAETPAAPRTATDEERATFKRQEYEAMRRIVAGDLICPDPSAHDGYAEAPAPAAPGLDCPACGVKYPSHTADHIEGRIEGWPALDDDPRFAPAAPLDVERLKAVIVEVIEHEAQDAMDTGMRPASGRELDAWNYVARHFLQWAPFAADRIVDRLLRGQRDDE